MAKRQRELGTILPCGAKVYTDNELYILQQCPDIVSDSNSSTTAEDLTSYMVELLKNPIERENATKYLLDPKYVAAHLAYVVFLQQLRHPHVDVETFNARKKVKIEKLHAALLAVIDMAK